MTDQNKWAQVLQVLETSKDAVESILAGPDPDGEKAKVINNLVDQINTIRKMHLGLSAIHSHT